MAAIQPFDAELHHVGLGDDAASLNGFLITGTYSRRGQRDPFGKISDVGTDSLIGSDRLSVWTQRNYSGGEFQRDWSDDAMFSECGHFAPNQLGLGIRSVPPIVPIDGGQGNGNVVLTSIDLLDGNVYTTNVTESGSSMKVVQYQGLSNRLTPYKKWQYTIQAVGTTALKLPNCAAWNYSTRTLWVGYRNNGGLVNTFTIQDIIDQQALQKTGIQLIQKDHLTSPTDPTYGVQSIQDITIFNPFKLAATTHPGSQDFVRLWNYVGGADAATKWISVGILPGDVVATCIYNNAAYYLTRTSDGITQLSMTNGSEVFPILKLPYYFRGTAMVEYAGRLMIAGAGFDLDGNAHHGELYEVNGTSLRLVRTFKDEADRSDDVRGAMSTIKFLGVVEGMLVMSDDSCAGVEFYDATTDSFYGGSRLMRDPFVYAGQPATQIPEFSPQSVSLGDLSFTNCLTMGSTFLLWGKSDRDAASGLYRVLENRDTDTAYSPYIVTSDFSPEPGRTKSWSEVNVITRYAAPLLQVSIDSGDNWITCPRTDLTSSATRYEATYDLSAVPEAHAIRLKFIFTRHGTSGEDMVEMIAHSLSFGVHASGKCGFAFNVALAEHVGPYDPQSGSPILHQEDTLRSLSDYIWDAYHEGRTLTYVDPDGAAHSVYLSNVEETRPALTKAGERLLQLSLLEL